MIKVTCLWLAVLGVVLVQIYFSAILTATPTLTHDGLWSYLGLTISEKLINLFGIIELASIPVCLLAGLVGGVFFTFRKSSFSIPYWFLFVFNLLNAAWVFIAAAAGA